MKSRSLHQVTSEHFDSSLGGVGNDVNNKKINVVNLRLKGRFEIEKRRKAK